MNDEESRYEESQGIELPMDDDEHRMSQLVDDGPFPDTPYHSRGGPSSSEPEYFLFHSGFDTDEDEDTCLLKIHSIVNKNGAPNPITIFIRYSFTLLCSPAHFAQLDNITQLSKKEQEILYKDPLGKVVRTSITDALCKDGKAPPHSRLTVDDIPVTGERSLYDYDKMIIKPTMRPRALFDDAASIPDSQISTISRSGTSNGRLPIIPEDQTMRPATRAATLELEFNNLAGIIVDLYGLSDAIQMSLGKLHNSFNKILVDSSFGDVVCQQMEPFCQSATDTGGGSKSFDLWIKESPDNKKNELMCLKSAYVSRAENSCKVHDKPEAEIVKKMAIARPNISDILRMRGCEPTGHIGSLLTEMDNVFKKYFASYMSSNGGGVSQEKCRLAITDYQSSFGVAMEGFGCPIPMYDRLGEMARTRTSRVDNAAKNINLGFKVQTSNGDGGNMNIADSKVRNGQALVCDATNPLDFDFIRMIAHLNSSEIDAARLSLNMKDSQTAALKPLVLLIENPVYDEQNTRTEITPIPCDFTGTTAPLSEPKFRELHEGDGGLFVFLSIPWFTPEFYRSDSFRTLSRDDKSKVIRPIICVYKITQSFPANENYAETTQSLHKEFTDSLQKEYISLKTQNPNLFNNCRVPNIKHTIRRLGVEYSFVFGITTTRGGISNNLTLALILPHLNEGGGAKCFRGTCDVKQSQRLLEYSGCTYLQGRHFEFLRKPAPSSLTELNFLLGLNLKEYGDSTKALCAEIMRSYDIPTVLASVDWCLLLRQFEGVSAFRSDNVYKICGTTELKPLDRDEILKIATLQALFMCYPNKEELLAAAAATGNMADAIVNILSGLNQSGSSDKAADAAYDLFQTHIRNKLDGGVIRSVDTSLARFRDKPTLSILPDYCEFVLFRSKLKTSNFLVEKKKFVDMISRPVTSHGHHVCHDMLDFFDKSVIDIRKIDSFEYERMKLMEVKETDATNKLLEQLRNVPIHNPIVQQKLSLKKSLSQFQKSDTEIIINQTKSDLIGIFSNCSLFELLLLANHYTTTGENLNFRSEEGKPIASNERGEKLAPIPPFTAIQVKEMLTPPLWAIFHEFFGAECGIRDINIDPDVRNIIKVLGQSGFRYMSPEEIVRIKEDRIQSVVNPRQGPGLLGIQKKPAASLKAVNPPIQTPRGVNPRAQEKNIVLERLKNTAKRNAAAASPQTKKKKRGGSRTRKYKKAYRKSSIKRKTIKRRKYQ